MRLHASLRQAFGTVTNKSGTTTGVSALVIAANAQRLGYAIENPSAVALNANGDNLYVKLGGAAAIDGTSWEVLPGGYFPPPSLEGWMGDVYVYGAGSVSFTAAELT